MNGREAAGALPRRGGQRGGVLESAARRRLEGGRGRRRGGAMWRRAEGRRWRAGHNALQGPMGWRHLAPCMCSDASVPGEQLLLMREAAAALDRRAYRHACPAVCAWGVSQDAARAALGGVVACVPHPGRWCSQGDMWGVCRRRQSGATRRTVGFTFGSGVAAACRAAGQQARAGSGCMAWCQRACNRTRARWCGEP